MVCSLFLNPKSAFFFLVRTGQASVPVCVCVCVCLFVRRLRLHPGCTQRERGGGGGFGSLVVAVAGFSLSFLPVVAVDSGEERYGAWACCAPGGESRVLLQKIKEVSGSRETVPGITKRSKKKPEGNSKKANKRGEKNEEKEDFPQTLRCLADWLAPLSNKQRAFILPPLPLEPLSPFLFFASAPTC